MSKTYDYVDGVECLKNGNKNRFSLIAHMALIVHWQ